MPNYINLQNWLEDELRKNYFDNYQNWFWIHYRFCSLTFCNALTAYDVAWSSLVKMSHIDLSDKLPIQQKDRLFYKAILFYFIKKQS